MSRNAATKPRCNGDAINYKLTSTPRQLAGYSFSMEHDDTITEVLDCHVGMQWEPHTR
jgi:hypothetical protein